MLFLVIIGVMVTFSGCVQPQSVVTPTPTVIPSPTTPIPPTSPPTPTQPKITVSSPKGGDNVSLRQIVKGTSTGVYGSGLSIYVLVYPIAAGGPWWVQPEVSILTNGNWETNAYFGDPANPSVDIGKKFKISAIITSVKLKEGMRFGKVEDVSGIVYRIDIEEVVRI